MESNDYYHDAFFRLYRQLYNEIQDLSKEDDRKRQLQRSEKVAELARIKTLTDVLMEVSDVLIQAERVVYLNEL